MQIITDIETRDLADVFKRPSLGLDRLESLIKDVYQKVQQYKDRALFDFTKRFDKVELTDFLVSQKEFVEAEDKVEDDLKKAILEAKDNIHKFHRLQTLTPMRTETTDGVLCWQESRPIQKVGLYIPGGTAPLFSTVLMLGIPAKLAGCEEIILTTPPDPSGKVHPAILWTARQIGINKVFKLGGSQAVAAMAIGTETVPKVDKIFGPGNQFVVKAKQIAQNYGVAIDMPAGPSEVLIVADKEAKPEFLASDLLAQAEHGPDSQTILISNNLEILKKTKVELEKQLKNLPRKEIAKESLQHSKFILTKTLAQAFDLANIYAPEHLIIQTENYLEHSRLVKNAGSVFLGEYTPESLGDYASGTNHSLPTGGFARNYSGVCIDSFVKKISFQEVNQKGLRNISRTVQTMAKAEGLEGHSRSVEVRLG